MDSQGPPGAGMPSNLQKNIGYVTYVIAGSVLSVLLYAYILIIKLRNKPRNHHSDLIALFLAFGFQHAVATVLAVNNQNTQGQYNFDQSQLGLLQSMNLTGPTVNNYSN
jgi:hypothetical protein